MTTPNPDTLSRLQKMVVDSEEVDNYGAAAAYFEEFRLQIVVGRSALHDSMAQAAVLTAVNTGVRAFPGGVTLVTEGDTPCTVAWHANESTCGAAQSLGATIGMALNDHQPTIVFGTPRRVLAGRPILFARAWGWCAAVGQQPRVSVTPPISPAAMLCGGLAVAEAFQARRGDVFAGRRETGISLWRPDLPVFDTEAVGPKLEYLFSEAWLIGLGHLGQAYAWGLGLLPIADRARFGLMLQDDDVISKANMDTSLLAHPSDVGRLKTRLVCERMESIGFAPRITERRLDERQRIQAGEPRLAFVGVDRPEPRSVLSSCAYRRVIDLGLGAGSEDYMGMDLHRFPASRRSEDIYGTATSEDISRRGEHLLRKNQAYRDLAATGDRCGVLEIAQRTVATSFVGAVAAAIGLADPLRALHNGSDFEVLSLSLQDPSAIACSEAATSDPALLPSYHSI